MTMKKVFCLLLVLTMMLCLISCGSGDVGKSEKPDDNDPIGILKYVNRSEGDVDDEAVYAMSFLSQMDMSGAGMTMSVTFEMDAKMKNTNEGPVLSAIMSLAVPLSEKIEIPVFMEKDTMYMLIDGITLKQVADDDDDDDDSVDIIAEIIDVHKSASSRREGLNIIVDLEIDITKDLQFLDDYFMLPMMDESVTAEIFDDCKVQFVIDSSYYMEDIILSGTWTDQEDGVGSINYSVTSKVSGEKLEGVTEVLPPDGMDIENAIDANDIPGTGETV